MYISLALGLIANARQRQRLVKFSLKTYFICVRSPRHPEVGVRAARSFRGQEHGYEHLPLGRHHGRTRTLRLCQHGTGTYLLKTTYVMVQGAHGDWKMKMVMDHEKVIELYQICIFFCHH